jgi:hypothetical protein
MNGFELLEQGQQFSRRTYDAGGTLNYLSFAKILTAAEF